MISDELKGKSISSLLALPGFDLNQEDINYILKKFLVLRYVERESISDFNWREIVEEVKRSLATRTITNFKDEDIINYAIDYWIKGMTNPDIDNGDDSLEGRRLRAVFSELADPITKEEAEEFSNSFRKHVKSKLLSDGEVILAIDYQPSGLLRDILEDTTIGLNSVPIKTRMCLGYNYLKISTIRTPEILVYADESYYKGLILGHIKSYYNCPETMKSLKTYSYAKSKIDNLLEEMKDKDLSESAELFHILDLFVNMKPVHDQQAYDNYNSILDEIAKAFLLKRVDSYGLRGKGNKFDMYLEPDNSLSIEYLSIYDLELHEEFLELLLQLVDSKGFTLKTYEYSIFPYEQVFGVYESKGFIESGDKKELVRNI